MKDKIEDLIKNVSVLSPDELNIWKDLLRENMDGDLATRMENCIPKAQIQHVMKR